MKRKRTENAIAWSSVFKSVLTAVMPSTVSAIFYTNISFEQEGDLVIIPPHQVYVVEDQKIETQDVLDLINTLPPNPNDFSFTPKPWKNFSSLSPSLKKRINLALQCFQRHFLRTWLFVAREKWQKDERTFLGGDLRLANSRILRSKDPDKLRVRIWEAKERLARHYEPKRKLDDLTYLGFSDWNTADVKQLCVWLKGLEEKKIGQEGLEIGVWDRYVDEFLEDTKTLTDTEQAEHWGNMYFLLHEMLLKVQVQTPTSLVLREQTPKCPPFEEITHEVSQPRKHLGGKTPRYVSKRVVVSSKAPRVNFQLSSALTNYLQLPPTLPGQAPQFTLHSENEKKKEVKEYELSPRRSPSSSRSSLPRQNEEKQVPRFPSMSRSSFTHLSEEDTEESPSRSASSHRKDEKTQQSSLLRSSLPRLNVATQGSPSLRSSSTRPNEERTQRSPSIPNPVTPRYTPKPSLSPLPSPPPADKKSKSRRPVTPVTPRGGSPFSSRTGFFRSRSLSREPDRTQTSRRSISHSRSPTPRETSFQTLTPKSRSRLSTETKQQPTENVIFEKIPTPPLLESKQQSSRSPTRTKIPFFGGQMSPTEPITPLRLQPNFQEAQEAQKAEMEQKGQKNSLASEQVSDLFRQYLQNTSFPEPKWKKLSNALHSANAKPPRPQQQNLEQMFRFVPNRRRIDYLINLMDKLPSEVAQASSDEQRFAKESLLKRTLIPDIDALFPLKIPRKYEKPMLESLTAESQIKQRQAMLNQIFENSKGYRAVEDLATALPQDKEDIKLHFVVFNLPEDQEKVEKFTKWLVANNQWEHYCYRLVDPYTLNSLCPKERQGYMRDNKNNWKPKPVEGVSWEYWREEVAKTQDKKEAQRAYVMYGFLQEDGKQTLQNFLLAIIPPGEKRAELVIFCNDPAGAFNAKAATVRQLSGQTELASMRPSRQLYDYFENFIRTQEPQVKVITLWAIPISERFWFSRHFRHYKPDKSNMFKAGPDKFEKACVSPIRTPDSQDKIPMFKTI